MKLNNVQLVVITGAGSGIGRAAALRFAQLGATVIATDLDELTAQQTATLIEASGGKAYAYRLDVTDIPAFEELAARIKAEHGVTDVVVNNAGIVKVGGSLTHTAADWQRVLAVDLSGVVHGCRLFGAQMVERGRGGHLVNIASMAAFVPTAVGPAYCVAKAGVRMLSESLRAELATDHIGVTAICPGLINTNISRAADYLAVADDQADDRHQALFAFANRVIPFGVVSQPDVVAAAIVRAVRRNQVVVPVRPEAWLGYALSRLAPGANRGFARLANEATVEKLGRIATKSVRRRLPTGAGR
jgi:NAD(P)-dependent dehydrogenase (short-subunit alcohol dehydrogenase family)